MTAYSAPIASFPARLARAIWAALDKRNVGLIAAGVAFYSMFAIFPGMAAIIALWGIFSDPMVMQDYLANLHGLIPEAAFGLIETQMNALISAHSSGWRWATVLPLAIALYSVHSAVSALISGLNAVQERGHRAGFMRLAGSLAITAALMVVILLALAMVVAVPLLLSVLPLGPLAALILRFLPWAVLIIVVNATLGLFYRFGATAAEKRHRWISTGSVVAAVLWALASFAFSLYLENFGSYNRVYGAIGAVIALMMWLYLSAYIVLFGAVLNAELARLQRAPQ
ncbi:MAG: YihY/virulence factor BrkB family protein [Albidovulum sp.]